MPNIHIYIHNCDVSFLYSRHCTYINGKTCKIMDGCEHTLASCVTYVSDLFFSLVLLYSVISSSISPSHNVTTIRHGKISSIYFLRASSFADYAENEPPVYIRYRNWFARSSYRAARESIDHAYAVTVVAAVAISVSRIRQRNIALPHEGAKNIRRSYRRNSIRPADANFLAIFRDTVRCSSDI